ncbi:hypothetical protein [uncultured Cohaesibacter sp.]|uniref:hypothetical protein n=1 Tax=uncultured Cohaesibacter sp. TaxID=1002546 RepID=UPI002AAC314C|nr:hypothetical protein [uncultured Cohaesibacter sp.]
MNRLVGLDLRELIAAGRLHIISMGKVATRIDKTKHTHHDEHVPDPSKVSNKASQIDQS